MALKEHWEIDRSTRDNLTSELTYIADYCEMAIGGPGGGMSRRDAGMVRARLLDLANRIAVIPITQAEAEEANDKPTKRPRAKKRAVTNPFVEPFPDSPTWRGGARISAPPARGVLTADPVYIPNTREWFDFRTSTSTRAPGNDAHQTTSWDAGDQIISTWAGLAGPEGEPENEGGE